MNGSSLVVMLAALLRFVLCEQVLLDKAVAKLAGPTQTLDQHYSPKSDSING